MSDGNDPPFLAGDRHMFNSLKRHWPEYLMEAAELGFFMISACAFGTLLEFPGSPVHQAISSPFARRVLMGLAMGLTALGIIYSPFGKRSGAHLNPAMTLTFFRLGKIERWDAVFYIIAQFAGGILGVAMASVALRQALAHPSVNYVMTMPGPSGSGVAFVSEAVISFILMTVVLNVSNRMNIAGYAGFLAAVLIVIYISLEGPLSGMSMNPARTFGSALAARDWHAIWIYFTAPPLGMLLAAEIYLQTNGVARVRCAKLHHLNDKRCIFRCDFERRNQPEITAATRMSLAPSSINH